MRLVALARIFCGTLGLIQICALSPAAMESGPMVGYVEARETVIWIKTDSEAQISIRYFPENEPGRYLDTRPLLTNTDASFITSIVLEDLEPDTMYRYSININGDEPKAGQGHFRTPQGEGALKPANFIVNVGGGIAREASSIHPVFDSMASTQAQATLWLGNLIDLGPEDWMTRGGYYRSHRQVRARTIPSALLRSQANYAVIGASDYGPPTATQLWFQRSSAIEVFQEFWPATRYVFGTGSINTQFRINDAEFFLLDAFSFRETVSKSPASLLRFGKEQTTWLLDALATSTARFKIVASGISMLNPIEGEHSFSSYRNEQQHLIEQIGERKIPGVLFVSGGRKVGELSKYIRPHGYPLFELESGCLSAEPMTPSSYQQINYFRVPGTLVFESHFVQLQFTGDAPERALRFSARDAEGKELWAETIRAEELK